MENIKRKMKSANVVKSMLTILSTANNVNIIFVLNALRLFIIRENSSTIHGL